jgi:hypothetical protein
MLNWLEGRNRASRLLSYSPEIGSSRQEYLEDGMGSRTCKPGYVHLLVELTQTRPLIIAEKIASLVDSLRRRAEYAQSAQTLDMLLQLSEDAASLMSANIVHGDFAPWNLRERRDGTCGLLDWESGEREGLPLDDLCHFFFMQALVFAPKQDFVRRCCRMMYSQDIAGTRRFPLIARPLWSPPSSPGSFWLLGRIRRKAGELSA